MKNIIILNGLIASGKTTIGKELVKALNKSGENAIFFDLDDEVTRLNPKDYWESEEDKHKTWLQARKNLAHITLKSLKDNDIVVVVGPFFDEEEIKGFTQYITFEIELYLFTLQTPVTMRISRNRSRIPSNNPKDIQEQDERFHNSNLQLKGAVVENTASIKETITLLLDNIKNHVGKIQ